MDIHVSVCTCMNINVCMLSLCMCAYPCIRVHMCEYTRVCGCVGVYHEAAT